MILDYCQKNCKLWWFEREIKIAFINKVLGPTQLHCSTTFLPSGTTYSNVRLISNRNGKTSYSIQFRLNISRQVKQSIY